jgi:hypothetical protein
MLHVSTQYALGEQAALYVYEGRQDDITLKAMSRIECDAERRIRFSYVFNTFVVAYITWGV